MIEKTMVGICYSAEVSSICLFTYTYMDWPSSVEKGKREFSIKGKYGQTYFMFQAHHK